jgi:hypothetical protein
MLVALALTHLIHPLGASLPYKLFQMPTADRVL